MERFSALKAASCVKLGAAFASHYVKPCRLFLVAVVSDPPRRWLCKPWTRWTNAVATVAAGGGFRASYRPYGQG